MSGVAAEKVDDQSERQSTTTEEYIGRIPVRNLWLLMLYASDLFRVHKDLRNVGFEEIPDELPDLIAKILAEAVERRLHRHFNFGYRSRDAVLNRVRGRIDVLATERHQLLARGLVACRFDELTVDTPRNRFVRAALETISRMVRPDIAHRCRCLAASMKAMGVSGNAPTRAEMSADRFGRHDVDDQCMVAAAKLAFDLALPTEAAGTNLLPLPDREVTWVRRLFERAVGGFYDVVLSPEGWRVRCGSMLVWQIEQMTTGIDKILPTMRTDVVLDHPASGQRIVIDTKFTSILTSGWHREETLRSGYVYQIYAYLRSQVGCGDSLAERASGVLLHPSVGEMIDESVVIQGHVIRFATIDLMTTARGIRSQLLRLVKPGPFL
jgi:5-methylcytosine-specific restriction enzyme subunit McrC